MPVIKIHRGTRQIGGTITEIATDSTRIFIDFGKELTVLPEEFSDSKMIAMARECKPDAVLFSHYHGDHIGLLADMPENTPFYIGEDAAEILLIIRRKLLSLPGCENRDKIAREKLLLEDRRLRREIRDGHSFWIGDIRVTPFQVDHSAYDAYLFVLEAEGKVIVHTGDFRAHGRFGEGFFESLERKVRETLGEISADVLITEGTMLSRLNGKALTERRLQQAASALVRKPENKVVLLLCSSANIESLTSFYQAANHAKKYFFVPDYVLSILEYVGAQRKKTDRDFDFSRRIAKKNLEHEIKGTKTIQKDWIHDRGGVILLGRHDMGTVEEFRRDNPLLIYSLWDGYIDKNNPGYQADYGKIHDAFPQDRVVRLHTGGHATTEEIEQMIMLFQPQHIVPIHTEKKENFRQLRIADIEKRLCLLEDGQEYPV